MHPGLKALTATQNGVFGSWQARAHGYEHEEIRRLTRGRRWIPLRRGIYAEAATVAATEADSIARHRLDIAAGLLAVRSVRPPDRLVASHDSAIVLWGLETLKPVRLSPVRLTTSRPAARRTSYGLRITSAALPDDHVSLCDGVPTTSKARTTIDKLREWPFRAGVVLADSALRSGVSKTELEAVLADCSTWRGGIGASRAVAFADDRAESVAESIARVVVLDLGLPTPNLQVPIHDADGLIGIGDLVFEDQRTILEVDGRLKYQSPNDPDALWREKKREDRLREAGWEVVRVTWAELLYHPERVRAKLWAAFARAERRRAR